MHSVLLVDDDRAERYILKRFNWKSTDFYIAGEAADGKEALILLKKTSFDLIITDIRMPGMDGFSFLDEVRRQNWHGCIVLLSTYSDFEYAQRGIRLGVFDYMTKPPSDKDLTAVLQRIHTHLTSEKYLQEEIAKKYEIHNDSTAAKICRFILNNVENNITLDNFAQEFSLSHDYAGKYFKQKMGKNFNDYLTKIKMEHAKYLLRSGKYKTYEISNKLGYANPDYFRRLFKLNTNMTPGEYKRSSDTEHKSIYKL
ncbi:response regulator [Pectinatus brassicae]|uniref:YesN/AraC family two-component response regulator n=1 Tax=Pectinatus brassicae TaxID=862415 RepID=A0A840USU7_9FIRM|nr:response regulator [Pectinatus brassicae]MBB5336033.1 YesN/AraC family two-component response regulator [Pectinatus brassicae]